MYKANQFDMIAKLHPVVKSAKLKEIYELVDKARDFDRLVAALMKSTGMGEEYIKTTFILAG